MRAFTQKPLGSIVMFASPVWLNEGESLA